ncbi:MAG: hypothetical protein WBR33_12275 [Pseudonocardiaceae bacterium]
MTSLMRSISDPGVPAVGQWTLAEVAMHLSQIWITMPGMARRDLSRYHEMGAQHRWGGRRLADPGHVGQR